MPPRTGRWIGLALLLSLAGGPAGCAKPSETFTSVGSSIKPTGGAPAEAPAPGAEQAKDAADPAAKAPVAERKIIYTATLDLVVKELDAAVADVNKLTDGYKGYVAKSEVRSDAGGRRTATFTLRVPAEGFRPLVAGLVALGHPERDAVDSQDVTEEFVDVQARLKNLKKEEDTLNQLLEKSGSRDEVLRTRQEIRAIRGDIERAQARLDYLSKLTALSTVNLTLREVKDYKPPAPPTFASRVAGTFATSWDGLVHFVTELALLVVALVPWLPVLLPLGVVAYLGIRRRRSSTASVRPLPPTGRGSSPHSAAGEETAVEPPPDPPAEGRPL